MIMLLVMPMVMAPQVMPRLMELLVMPMVRMLQVMLRLMTPLVIMIVRALQVMILGVGRHVSGCLLVLGVGTCHSWWRAWSALLVGLLAGPGGVSRLRCWGGSLPILAEGGDVVGEGAAGDAMVTPMLRAL